jgi:hypothetical protein
LTAGGEGAGKGRSVDAREGMPTVFGSPLWLGADDSERSATAAAQDDAVDPLLASTAGGLRRSMDVQQEEQEQQGVFRDGARRLRAEAAEAREQARAVGDVAAALARMGRTAHATAATELARQWTHRAVRLRARLAEFWTEGELTSKRRRRSTHGDGAPSSERGSVAPVGARATAAAADWVVPDDAQALQRLREEVRATLLDVKRLHASAASWTEAQVPQLATAATMLARRWAAHAEHAVERVRAAEHALGTSGGTAGAAAGASRWRGSPLVGSVGLLHKLHASSGRRSGQRARKCPVWRRAYPDASP